MNPILNTLTLRYPMSEADVRAECPLTAFPVPFELPEAYVVPVDTPVPAHDAATHRAVELLPVFVADPTPPAPPSPPPAPVPAPAPAQTGPDGFTPTVPLPPPAPAPEPEPEPGPTGTWHRAWEVVELTAEEKATRTAATAASLAQTRIDTWEAIKRERDRRIQEGGYRVTVSGTPRWFHSDTFSRTQQMGLVMLGANIPAGLQWKTLSGDFVPMTQQLAGQVFGAAAANDTAIFAKAEQHRAAMLQAANPAGYDFTGGWPAAFGG